MSSLFDWLLGPKIPVALLIRLPLELQKTKRLRGKKLDPITAIFNFLATPVGQEICKDVMTEIQDLIKLFHGKQTAAAPAK